MSRSFPNSTGNYLGTGALGMTAMNASDALTVAFWTLARSIANYDQPVSRWYEPGNARIWAFTFDSSGGGNSFRFDTSADGNFNPANKCVSSATGFRTLVWMHIAGVHDPIAQTNSIWINGKLDAQIAGVDAGLADITQEINIGAGTFAALGTQKYDGLVSDLGVWRAVLGGDEIGRLALGTLPRFIRPQVLIGDFPLNDYQGGTSLDRSSTAMHVTMTGTVTIDAGMDKPAERTLLLQQLNAPAFVGGGLTLPGLVVP